MHTQTTPKRPAKPPKRPPIYHADCIEIPLTRGLSAFVDLDCPPEILRHNWHAEPSGYVARNCRASGKHKIVRLHREILGLAPDDPLHVDHHDGNRQNNRRANLRPCTNRQNGANRGAYQNSTSQYRGVCWYAARGKWIAQLGREVAGRRYKQHLGYFDSEIEAALAWDAAAIASGWYDLAFLRLNFPPGREQTPASTLADAPQCA